jgi:hypothetical protein
MVRASEESNDQGTASEASNKKPAPQRSAGSVCGLLTAYYVRT